MFNVHVIIFISLTLLKAVITDVSHLAGKYLFSV